MKHFANSILEKQLLPVKSICKYLHPAARCLVIPHTYLTIVGRKNILSVAIGIHPTVHYLSGRGLTLGDILRSTGKCKRELWVVFYLQSNKIAFEYQSVIF